jgi:hypothetical protein
VAAALIHVVLVSDQVLANLIPALMERPDKLVAVCTPEMAARGLDRRLKMLLGREAIAVEIKSGAPDVGIRQIQEFALQLAAELEQAHPGAQIVLNATGGTKLMPLGFVEVFRGLAAAILYTDTAHRRIELLPDPHGESADPLPMTDVLDVPAYLAAQGFRYRSAVSDDMDWRERAAGRKVVSKYLGRSLGSPYVQEFVGVINALADQALERVPGTDEERLAAPSQHLRKTPWGEWASTLTELARAGLIDWRDGEDGITFADAEAALFLRGGWLEEYAWHIVKDGRVSDARMGVRGVWENAQEASNEFDVLACHLNQLLFIECKTLRYRGGNDNEIAYKVDSLSRDARGLFGETWLLSARAPTDVLTERARQARIRIIGPKDLPRLRAIVRAWMWN